VIQILDDDEQSKPIKQNMKKN